MGGAKTFTKGWPIRCSQARVDGQGKRHQRSGTGDDKGAVGMICRCGPTRITESGAINARYSTST
jgi:hypothetical protein